jgi:hypothetical protein
MLRVTWNPKIGKKNFGQSSITRFCNGQGALLAMRRILGYLTTFYGLSQTSCRTSASAVALVQTRVLYAEFVRGAVLSFVNTYLGHL